MTSFFDREEMGYEDVARTDDERRADGLIGSLKRVFDVEELGGALTVRPKVDRSAETVERSAL